jgi:hypothetical protein
MFLNSWSLGLTVTTLAVLVLGAMAGRTALRVLRYWDPASDSNRQIRLESETWLASTLVEYLLGFQIATLILFVLAADQFCQVIVGAMCITGALLANGFGMPALAVKVAGVFLYGFWIVLHQLDITSEKYPLVKLKYIYLLCLLPFLLLDATLQTMYIAGLRPDIITSCCGVVFGTGGNQTGNLLANFDHAYLLLLFYGCIILLIAIAIALKRFRFASLVTTSAFCWAWFFVLALVTITVVLSSYIYAMPNHRCPFCILKPEYHYIGFAIYTALIVATFAGLTVALVHPLRSRADLGETVQRYQGRAVRVSLIFLLLFTALSSYHWLTYIILGGEQ